MYVMKANYEPTISPNNPVNFSVINTIPVATPTIGFGVDSTGKKRRQYVDHLIQIRFRVVVHSNWIDERPELVTNDSRGTTHQHWIDVIVSELEHRLSGLDR